MTFNAKLCFVECIKVLEKENNLEGFRKSSYVWEGMMGYLKGKKETSSHIAKCVDGGGHKERKETKDRRVIPVTTLLLGKRHQKDIIHVRDKGKL